MMTEGTNLLLLTISAFWIPSGAPEGREVSNKVVVIDRLHYIKAETSGECFADAIFKFIFLNDYRYTSQMFLMIYQHRFQ